MIKVLTWNCRGIGNRHFLRAIKRLCAIHTPDILCLLETRSFSTNTEKIPVKLGFPHNFRVPSEGFAGGLWLLWKNTGFTLTILSDDYQCIHSGITFHDYVIILSFAYVRPYAIDKDIFWSNTYTVSPLITLPWAIMGDFNDIANMTEKRGGRDATTRCDIFTSRIESCYLNQTTTIGPKFIWRDQATETGNIRMRLDRVLVNQHWQTLLTNSHVSVLPNTSW